MERAIANGYDANLPSFYIEWKNDEKIITETPTLAYFFGRIEFLHIKSKNSRKIAYLLFANTLLDKAVIDEIRGRFSKRYNLVNGKEIDFFRYLNSVFKGRSDCPSFFFENYSEEIIKNEYINLLPQTAKDIFVFP